MKLAWKILVAAGLLLLMVAMGMSTTVAVGNGREVHNIGLQHQQTVLLILGSVLFLAGVMIFGVMKLKQTPEEEASEKERLRASTKELESRIQEEMERWSGGPSPAARSNEPPNGSKQIELRGDISDLFRR